MPHASLDALYQPFRKFLQRATQLSRRTSEGKIYLGEGQPVIVFPPFCGGPESTATLREQLDEAGFASYDWGLGADTGPGELGLNSALRRLEDQIVEAFETERRPLTLLGWGLSGIYAREVAKRTTPLVRQVITLGTPLNSAADPKHRCAMLRALEGSAGRVEPSLRHRLRQRPPVPTTSIYSVSDELVPWRMCVEPETLMSENVQVNAKTHLGLAEHPKVLEVITHRLSQPEDEWLPFDA
jgi:hypothetical protein